MSAWSSPSLSPSDPVSILHLEDSSSDAELVAVRLNRAMPACRIRRVTDRPQFEAALADGGFDLILSDYTLNGFDGLAALDLARTRSPHTPFVFLSGTIGEERAIDALTHGAFDYVIKDRPSRLVPAIRRALQRAREQDRLHHAEDHVRQQAALLDRAQDAIFVRDVDDRITFWNQSAARLYEWSPAEAVGADVHRLWTEPHEPVAEARRQTLLRGEWVGELRQRSRSGVEIVVQSRWSLIRNHDDAVSGFLVINTDIGERKRLETQFLRAQHHESIGLLAGGVAHDINNLLVPILSAADLLETTEDPAEARALLEAIRTSARHGAALVRQLVAFSRGAVGDVEDVCLGDLLADFGAFVAQTFPTNIALFTPPATDTWRIRADATQLKQVLVNLCINARDAMPGGGAITIVTNNVLLDAPAAARLHEITPGPYVEIEVSDTGTGMPPETLARIFDPFFTTKPVGKGTGLGLAAVRGIVKGHHGAITVDSTPGAGTTFRIFLPALVDSPAPTPPTATAPANPCLGRGILIVDDEESVRNLLSAVLSAAGFKVYPADCAATALDLRRRLGSDVDLILTDVMMPDIDGFSMIEHLRTEGCTTPVITISGLAGSRAFEERAQALGVPLLSKPLSRATLVGAIHDALNVAIAQ